MCNGVEGSPYRSDTTAQPTDGAGQCNVRPPQRVGCGLDALRGQCHDDAVLDRGKQTRLSRSKEVRKQAECLMTLGAIPPRDTQSLWGYAPIAAMAGKRAAALRMQRADGQLGTAPSMVPDIRRGARRYLDRNLQ
jgi:hypothetical protein